MEYLAKIQELEEIIASGKTTNIIQDKRASRDDDEVEEITVVSCDSEVQNEDEEEESRMTDMAEDEVEEITVMSSSTGSSSDTDDDEESSWSGGIFDDEDDTSCFEPQGTIKAMPSHDSSMRSSVWSDSQNSNDTCSLYLKSNHSRVSSLANESFLFSSIYHTSRVSLMGSSVNHRRVSSFLLANNGSFQRMSVNHHAPIDSLLMANESFMNSEKEFMDDSSAHFFGIPY